MNSSGEKDMLTQWRARGLVVFNHLLQSNPCSRGYCSGLIAHLEVVFGQDHAACLVRADFTRLICSSPLGYRD
jgi:hypothetical protein